MYILQIEGGGEEVAPLTFFRGISENKQLLLLTAIRCNVLKNSITRERKLPNAVQKPAIQYF